MELFVLPSKSRLRVKSFHNNMIFYLAMLSILIILSGPIFPKYVSYFAIFLAIVFSFFDKVFIFVLLGSSNFLPIIGTISPMNLFVMVLFINTLVRPLKLYLKNNILLSLFTIVIWVAISSIVQGFDITFLITLIKGFMTMFLVYEYSINRKTEVRNVSGPFFIGVYAGVLVSLLSLGKVFGYYSTNPYRLTLLRGDSNSLGLSLNFVITYCSTNILMSFKKNKSAKMLFYLVLVIPTVFVLFLTGSRGSLLSAAMGVIMGLFYTSQLKPYDSTVHRKRSFTKFIILLVLVSVGVILVLNIDSFLFLSEEMFAFVKNRLFTFEDPLRTDLYSKALLNVLSAPLFGGGLSRYLLNTQGMLSHNSYLDYAISGGLVSLCLLLAVLFSIFVKSLNKVYWKKNASFLPTLVAFFAVAINQFTYSAVGDKLFWIPLSLILLNFDSYKGMLTVQDDLSHVDTIKATTSFQPVVF